MSLSWVLAIALCGCAQVTEGRPATSLLPDAGVSEEAEVSKRLIYYESNPVFRINYQNDSTTDEKKEIQEKSSLYKIVNAENSELPSNSSLKMWKVNLTSDPILA
ncbi:hypothetical protein Q1695_003686 [Nippostrongylus brasiliensis]|nr:hypothetical protein Q1695_003686 [Nippostrongylus brasiliensis]